jgi:hypothetical protein
LRRSTILPLVLNELKVDLAEFVFFDGGTPDKNRVDHPVAQRYAFKSWAMTPAAWQYSL